MKTRKIYELFLKTVRFNDNKKDLRTKQKIVSSITII